MESAHAHYNYVMAPRVLHFRAFIVYVHTKDFLKLSNKCAGKWTSPFHILRHSYIPLQVPCDCGTNVDTAYYIFIAIFARKPTRMCTRGISFMNIILWLDLKCVHVPSYPRVSLHMRRIL